MGLTRLEDDMFLGTNTTHAVVDFVFRGSVLRMTVAPWADLSARNTKSFESFHLVSAHVLDAGSPSADEPTLPWDIIGFDAADMGNDCWRFVLQCAEIEYIWQSSWPVAGSSAV